MANQLVNKFQPYCKMNFNNFLYLTLALILPFERIYVANFANKICPKILNHYYRSYGIATEHLKEKKL